MAAQSAADASTRGDALASRVADPAPRPRVLAVEPVNQLVARELLELFAQRRDLLPALLVDA